MNLGLGITAQGGSRLLIPLDAAVKTSLFCVAHILVPSKMHQNWYTLFFLLLKFYTYKNIF